MSTDPGIGHRSATSNQVPSKNIHINPCFKNILVNKAKLATPVTENQINLKKENKIYYNPKFLTSEKRENYKSVIHVNRNFLVDSTSKINLDLNEPQKPEFSSNFDNAVSKYKYINKTTQIKKSTSSSIQVKTKYSIIKNIPLQPKNKKNIENNVFQRITPRKIIRKSLKKPFLNKSLVTRYKLIRINKNLSSTGSSSNSEFRKISKTKLIRKSLLQQTIEKRRQVRTNINSKKFQMTLIDKSFKSRFSFKKSQEKHKRKSIDTKKRLIINTFTRLLKKNNQLCTFYNRFGRCKGKDKGTCNKIHDPKYVTICRKLLKGECTDMDCLLSHDVRPEKMPTCLHYLSGLCKNEDCPFLHIKVNEKAPICKYFLQGFCPDVYNCTKRHEYVCPIFAEIGNCPRGKSCVYPHKNHSIKSRLLGPDEKPLLPKKEKDKKNESQIKIKQESKPFTRYFTIPLENDYDTDDSSCSDDSSCTDDSSCSDDFDNSNVRIKSEESDSNSDDEDIEDSE